MNVRPVVRGLALAVLALLAHGATPAGGQAEPPEPVLPGKMITIKAAPVTVLRGGTTEAVVKIDLLPDYHVLASPPMNQWLTPASLAVESAAGVVARAPVFPPSTTTRDEDGGKPMPVWQGSFEIRVPIVVSEKAEPGEVRLKAQLRYQVHHMGEFYHVATRAFEIRVTVGKKKTAPATRP